MGTLEAYIKKHSNTVLFMVCIFSFLHFTCFTPYQKLVRSSQLAKVEDILCDYITNLNGSWRKCVWARKDLKIYEIQHFLAGIDQNIQLTKSTIWDDTRHFLCSRTLTGEDPTLF